ncbi:MAG: 4Fe-4S dicluster domain-containing protein [Halobacteriota archaeon]|nr:4Fe-4S dicluster domain-containing protein [Halobacteriota archaeon]
MNANDDTIDDKAVIYIMGKQYEVPKGLTIMKAMEYAGYRFTRGCGCRGGFCGACATVYRTLDDYKIKVGLACQTVVEDGMYLAQIPFFPANKAIYNIDELTPTFEQVSKLYPEIYRCLACNTCTKICPQDLQVMDYMQNALRGNITEAANLSFDCIMCGLCASRCPAETVQYNIGILCRRLYARHIAPKAKHLEQRTAEIEEGKFDEALDKLTKTDEEELKKMYEDRDIEP